MIVEKSFKYNGEYLKKGQRVDIEEGDIVRLERKGFISNISAQLPPKRPQSEPRQEKGKQDKQQVAEVVGVDYESFTKAELKVMLDNKNIDYLESDTKQELIDKLIG